MREKENLTLLGNQQTEYRMDYDPSVLEAFQNKHPENDYRKLPKELLWVSESGISQPDTFRQLVLYAVSAYYSRDFPGQRGIVVDVTLSVW